jgi:Fe-S-cluster containining protein
MEEYDKLKQKVLKEYPRLGIDDKFKFACKKAFKCFTKCCADVNIFLTPYDILRMKKRLNIKSGQFLEEYTMLSATRKESDKTISTPMVVLKMDNPPDKKCPFIREDGCTIYEDRPWSCRMYPIGLASQKTRYKKDGEEFYFLLKEDGCDGFKENEEWSIRKWEENQGIHIYNKMNESFKEINLHPVITSGKGLTPEQTTMYFLACYDLDNFREFIFKSNFFNAFQIDEKIKEKVKVDDEALLDFAFLWLRFSLLGEPTLTLKEEVVKRKKAALGLDKI